MPTTHMVAFVFAHSVPARFHEVLIEPAGEVMGCFNQAIRVAQATLPGPLRTIS
ncbi:hypothetical protein HMJ29_02305 [Hymenobacter taeanensis]|uniref:Uncharacterized protein n=1 Tax=Hymenobacter taeanensis TaxID=2735321 RepID=A0A6M6BCU8_9BACT|nr:MULTISPECIES: hypothetical protein [Hymenobacter]QJX45829.1 hypothetical protein HMJ29_02305 [Hymenobacter taeanensis]UOQ79672.1 hypothetical protein MUN83_12510 [Hymenobacter sp. 5414T-23]